MLIVKAKAGRYESEASMSQTNLLPPGLGPGFAFLHRQLGLLGDRDPLQVLAATASKLERIVAENDPEALKKRPVPDKWAPLEILAHLADTEWVFGFRIRTIFCDEQPRLLGVDQDRWVRLQQAMKRDAQAIVSEFRLLRERNVALWSSMNSEDLKRVGHHETAAIDFSLGLLQKIQAGHDLSHLDQLQRLLTEK